MKNTNAFTGISKNAAVVVTSIDHEGFTSVFGSVRDWPFATKRENYGDAIQASIKRALEAGEQYREDVMDAFQQIVADRALANPHQTYREIVATKLHEQEAQ